MAYTYIASGSPYSISDWDIIPENDTHSEVQPVDQTSTLGVFNITNNEAFNLTIQFFTVIYTYIDESRLIEDFNNIIHWKIYDKDINWKDVLQLRIADRTGNLKKENYERQKVKSRPFRARHFNRTV